MASILGKSFGEWTVVEEFDDPRMVRVQCSCKGTARNVMVAYLESVGGSTNCGCKRTKGASGLKHGKSKTPLHRLWRDIKYRIKTQSSYGGLGMWPEWEASFELFEAYMLDNLGEKPDPTFTLDRIEVTKGYEPGNVRWASKQTQAQNRSNSVLRLFTKDREIVVGKKYDMLTVLELTTKFRNERNWYTAVVRCDCGTVKTVYRRQLLSPRTKSCGCWKARNLTHASRGQITFNGVTDSAEGWAKRLGIAIQTLNSRFYNGWSVEKALTTPLQTHRGKRAPGEDL